MPSAATEAPRERLRRLLLAEPSVDFACLFGSRAGGAARADSDWDVAVHLDSRMSSAQRFDLRRRLSASLSGPHEARVDLVVLNDAPALLAHRALSGESIITRDRAAYARFLVRTMGALDDERHFRAVHTSERQRRLREGRFGRS